MFSEQTLEQVKSYSEIVSVISEYVSLKRKGRNYVGFCPFHSEKTPSFTVSPDKQIWHCFGCHASGNLISFLMKIDNISFIEAVSNIARRAGIEIIDIYVCPHERSNNCDCIKPNSYFLEKAAKDYHIDLQLSFVVGDHPCDIQLAKNVGARGIFVLTGHGSKHVTELPEDTEIVSGIMGAVERIMLFHLDTKAPRSEIS